MKKTWEAFSEIYQKHIKTLATKRRLSDLLKIERFLKEKKVGLFEEQNKPTVLQLDLLKNEYKKWDNKKELNSAEKTIFKAFQDFVNK